MSERSPIRVMAPDLALKIAAGEVVERPASAVKELLDNAVDAGARHVGVEIREAGLKLIRLVDDGVGIPRGELSLAFASHATSKIFDLEDLEHLTTLGFRGEALASIAAVARVEVQTCARNETAGCRYVIEFGVERDVSTCAVDRGLRISVSDLFANVPARRKFVRSLRSEGGQIGTVVMLYALAQPDICFTLTMDGRSTFRSPGTGRLEDAVAAVHGPDVLAAMVPVDAEEHGIAVRGLITRPSLTRANRTGLSVFVNGRTIGNRSLVFALEEAFSGFLMSGRHPIAVVHLTLPPGEVDANIHPSKSEVRFARD
ncbi:MAG TPA: DNA mismatch repair endonuclease MutL, partial [Chloroflexota bacterium]